MNQRSLIAIIILAGIGSIGSVLAYSGTISAGQGNFNNVLVTGTCTGCGGESNFNQYNIIALNTTIGAAPDSGFRDISISNTGSVIFSGNTNNYYVTVSGVTKFVNASVGIGGSKEIAQSINGEYGVIFNGADVTVNVFKNSVYLQALGLHTAQFSSLGGRLGLAISPDGHYIAVVGQDSGLGSDRLVIFQGS